MNPSYFTSILLRFGAFGRDAGGIRSLLEEAWLRAAAPHGRSSLPCALNHRPAPLAPSAA
ncbi:hypothetical protein [Alkalicoccus urumqiensis]|uniref:hypothetical protein n=1 Tax=Alkalicoccus urumqiensis TaxID=1548213 RepID=UPI0015E5AC6C|nr:hypothetical protein [Alkalicoccus urumqiensis]